MAFTHLHTHTEYSLLDGAAPVKKLIARIKELGMDAAAITDHGNMYGAVEFYSEAKRQGIHPIIGCEVYVAPRSRFDKVYDVDNRTHHLILLAENMTGYRNLTKIVSAGFIDGFYYKPRVDFELLKEHHEGLIALSACLGGEIPKQLVADHYLGAKRTAEQYAQVFGRDNYFIELQDHGLPDQKRIMASLIQLAREVGVGLVATNDIHYINREDAGYQDVLMCIQTQRKVNDENRMRFDTQEFYVKSPEEMKALFAVVPEAITNTEKIARRCRVDFDFESRHLPAFEVPEGQTPAGYLKSLCYEGLKRRYPKDWEGLVARLDYELDTIGRMGFVDYFLIVWDFIHYAKTNGIMVGPGRGSAAGSMVSYCLEITDVDPIRFNLIFERFLNPERVSMPDIDIDFAPESRQRMIDYVSEKYGREQVCQIITFGRMKAKMAVRDVARALDFPYTEADRVAKLIPNDPKMTLDNALEISLELKELYEQDPKIRELLDTARALEGLPRNASTHAAGVVITKEPLVNYVPLQMNGDVITTQFEKDTIERMGLLKMDFLGLRNLTVIENAVKMIEKTRGIRLDMEHISFDEPEVFRLISAGNTDGVFQLESPGMKQFMIEMQPSTLEDIIAGISIYRPGPMNQRHQYIHNKKFPGDITYKHPLLEPILDVTYGFMVYQEQVLQIVRDLAGYSLGRADNLRRVISKKKADQMEIERHNFIYGLKDEDGNVVIPGCIANGISEDTAVAIFDEINDFANYAFNKSHAASYAFIAYQTAYLKTFYPAEFMAALISSVDDQNKINQYIQNCREMGIDRLPPDINKSEDTFTVENGNIRFGLSAVKNVGRGMILKIVEERKRGGAFTSFQDFLERGMCPEMNKRALECLIACGAFDSLGVYRSQLMAVYETLLDGVISESRNNIQGQMSLLDMDDEPQEVHYPNIPEFDKNHLLRMEHEMTGMYFSGHPMEEYRQQAAAVTRYTINDIIVSAEKDENGNFIQTGEGVSDGDFLCICGIISERKNKTTKKNQQMAFLKIEDAMAEIGVLVFPKVLSQYSPFLKEGEVVALAGRVSFREDEEPKLLMESVTPLADMQGQPKEPSSPDMPEKKVYIRSEHQDEGFLLEVRELLPRYPGNTPVVLFFADTKKVMTAPPSLWVRLDNDTEEALRTRFGAENVRVK